MLLFLYIFMLVIIETVKICIQLSGYLYWWLGDAVAISWWIFVWMLILVHKPIMDVYNKRNNNNNNKRNNNNNKHNNNNNNNNSNNNNNNNNIICSWKLTFCIPVYICVECESENSVLIFRLRHFESWILKTEATGFSGSLVPVHIYKLL